MRIHLTFTSLIIISLVISCSSPKGERELNDDKSSSALTKDERIQWWREAKFGMFIHWGPYAVPAGIHEGKETTFIAEWIMNTNQIPINRYEEYTRSFDPQDFDADFWVQLAKDAGMRYIVITSKHHDGFCLWDSEVSDYDIMDFSPYQKDILLALSDACKKYNIKFGLYHSIMDWHHPMAQSINEPHYWHGDSTYKINPDFPKYLEEYLKPQLKELITIYDPAILWFDGEWIPDYTHEQGIDLYNYVLSLKPDIIINNRVDKGRDGMKGMNKEGEYVGDFGTPEQEILAGTSDFDWESCMTMNDTWGYDQTDNNWKSSEQLIHNLIDVTAKGGNYLLNIGPMANGLIPDASIDRLKDMSSWMQVNSEAIYETERLKSGFDDMDSVRYVKKINSNTYYVFKMSVLPEKQLMLKRIQATDDTEITLLGNELKLSYSDDKELAVKMPDGLESNIQGQAWVFKIENAIERIN